MAPNSIHEAAAEGNVAMVRFFVEAGFDPAELDDGEDEDDEEEDGAPMAPAHYASAGK